MSTWTVSHPDVWTPRIRDEVRHCAPAEFALAFAESYHPERQAAYVRAGARYLTTQTDVGLLLAAASRATASLRDAAGRRTPVAGPDHA